MKRVPGYRRLFVVLTVLATVVMLAACGPKAVKPVGEMDTPDHHVYTGLKLLDQGQYSQAQGEFDRAVQLAPKFSRAFAGRALVKAYQNDFTGAFAALDKAWEYADTKDEKLFVHIGYIRVHTMNKAACAKIGTDCSQDTAWLDKCKDEFDNAVAINAKYSPAYYFMGLSYKTALDFGKAGQMFAKVMELKDAYTQEADVQWKLVQDIQRAMPGTVTGKKIALVEKLSRADAAALFMEEMKIDVLYKKRTIKEFDTAFKDPAKAQAPGRGAPTANDIATHPLKMDIEGMLQLGVRGMEAYPDGTFRPDEFVNRAAYALMIEDILIKITGDNTLATKFIGSTSTFPDLRNDLPYFNAVMVATSRGIMQAKSLTTGEFAPLETVSGVEALLIIKKFKEELKIF